MDFPLAPLKRVSPSSLRGRYLLVSALLGLLILASTILLQYFIDSTKSTHVRNMEWRNQTMLHTRVLRTALHGLEQSLEAYMWSPSAAARAEVQTAFTEVMEAQQALFDLPWMNSNQGQESRRVIELGLQQLRLQLERLMDTRVDKELQFPPLRLLRESSNPNHLAFTAAVNVALEELRRGERSSGPERLLNDLRNNWLLTVAQFRLYLANRVGLLFEEELDHQRANIVLLFGEVRRGLERLAELRRDGALEPEFELSDALRQMREAADNWYLAFQAIEAMDNNGEWRMDAPFLQTAVHPQLQALWGHIEALERTIETETRGDVNRLNNAGRMLMQAIWGLTVSAFSFMIIGFVFFERKVLSPIAMVAQALHAEASGERDIVLPEADTVETTNLISAFAKMRRQVQERQNDLEYQTLHDALTGLPNRRLLQDRLGQGIRQAQREGGALALLMLDLDGFKEINDTLGHATGDDLLRTVGDRLLRLLRQSDTVARLGGDEFAILLPRAHEAEAVAVARKILSRLEEPFIVGGHSLYVGCSIGIGFHPEHAADAEGLARCADVAMYVAKRNRNSFAVYAPDQDRDSLRRLSLGSELRDALNAGELMLFYQPQIGIRNGDVVGVEALLRWHPPQRGPIPPDEFIQVAEQTGLIRPLTYWVIEQVLRQCAAWSDRGFHYGRAAINLSAHNLQDGALTEQLKQLLQKWKVSPGKLTLEITESAMLADLPRAIATLARLRALGVRLAIDDFGTGFSSLAYLKRLAVQELKIDKSFVTAVAEDENDAVIVRSTIELAHNLGLEVVAEGIETQDALDLLEILDCDAGQGYLIGKPMPAEALEAWSAPLWRRNASSAS